MDAEESDHLFSIGIMQDKKGLARKYTPLVNYLKNYGISVKLVGFHSYRDAAIKFKNGKIDAMFAGSGVAGAMIIKKLAYPLVRPVHDGNWSTYWAVVIVPESTTDFKMTPEYMRPKRIICSALASSGEFFCRAFLGESQKLLIAGNHGNAIAALSRGAADIAVVKNRVWDQIKEEYPNLKKVAQDYGQNPDSTLIFSVNVNRDLVKKVKDALLNLKECKSIDAEALKKRLGICGYIVTEKKDFKHTLSLLKKAGVDKDFKF
jgi:ABC-type phosphate/phosphonate transport system substrate-binding protein